MKRSIRARRVAPLLASVLLALGCVPDTVLAPRAVVHPAMRSARSTHVVIISIDGLRPDAIAPAIAPTLARLAAEGSHTFAAHTILPSRTLPSHTSMLTGVGPDVHHVTWNDDRSAEAPPLAVPTVFAVAHTRGLVTAAVFAKTKFHLLEEPGSLDFDAAPSDDSTSWRASRTMPLVSRAMSIAPNLLFVHVGEPDYAGHVSGWMGVSYLAAVHAADRAVARVVAKADSAFGAGTWTLIVTADHGGHDRTHGSADRRDMTIPWIAWGRGVRAHSRIAADVRTTDTAATALWLLGVEIPSAWAGTAVVDAFE
jgi:predicted AlkP superfamily pyrophosphatase or phosphodiesterase